MNGEVLRGWRDEGDRKTGTMGGIIETQSRGEIDVQTARTDTSLRKSGPHVLSDSHVTARMHTFKHKYAHGWLQHCTTLSTYNHNPVHPQIPLPPSPTYGSD